MRVQKFQETLKLGRGRLRYRGVLPTIHRPGESLLRDRLRALAGLPLTYWERGATAWQRMPAGYAHATTRGVIGRGEADWAAARHALRTWKVVPDGKWVEFYPEPRVRAGAQVMVCFRLMRLWWTSPCRVVYVVDEPHRFGFAYGTLPGHVEQGEERFLVERDPLTGEVAYEVRVMARARHPGARLLPGLVARMQRRFREESLATLRAYVARRRSEPVVRDADRVLA